MFQQRSTISNTVPTIWRSAHGWALFQTRGAQIPQPNLPITPPKSAQVSCTPFHCTLVSIAIYIFPLLLLFTYCKIWGWYREA